MAGVGLALALLVAGDVAAQTGSGGRGGRLPNDGAGRDRGGTSSVDDMALIHHVLDRITYGATREDIELVRQIGVEEFIRLQLNPQLIPEDPVLAQKLAELPPQFTPVGDPLPTVWVGGAKPGWSQKYGGHCRVTARQPKSPPGRSWERTAARRMACRHRS